MIIRRLAASLHLITQPDHAALAARIIAQWRADGFLDSPRKVSILRATEQHDNGWEEIDQALVVDAASGQLLDFIEVPDAVKRETSSRGIERLAADPYAAALVAQHRLHVYRRFRDTPAWQPFFESVTAARDGYLRAAGPITIDELLSDYRFVRAGDLASLAFCNHWTTVDVGECGYAMRFDGTSLTLIPDSFGGASFEIAIEARELDLQPFTSVDDARRAVASASTVTLTGFVRGV